ncbi:MAG: malto-oligosyltrehalose trehalohydrolase [Desulfomonilaceae bacterium]
MVTELNRRLAVGAEVSTTGGTHFRVWAPLCQKVQVVFEQGSSNPIDSQVNFDLVRDANGYFSGIVTAAENGMLYRYRLDGGAEVYPDPASRFQPKGPHGPSEIVDPGLFTWTDQAWSAVSIEGQIFYEMHIGTFTQEGTWESAARELPELAEIGITALEVMPVAEFPGNFGWGYDGVNLFAPTRLYGRPDDFRRFVDKAHSLGMGVILDVVYNHLGPDGNYLSKFSDDYFTDRYETDWGKAINFDGHTAKPVRDFYISNACYWIEEFHLDGFRLDATQNIYDQSSEHILAAITRHVRRAAGKRAVILVAENEPQDVKLVRPGDQGGYGVDALWNDDFHHSAMVALTGHNQAYYTDYHGTPQELISAAKWGYLFQGQRYKHQKKRRGTPSLDLKPSTFVTFMQNHDQIANSGGGLRCHNLTSPGRYRAMTALMLLGPGTPMIFQGEEFAASSPFHYFADHEKRLARKVHQGRIEFLQQFYCLDAPDMKHLLPDPSDPALFRQAKLDMSERRRHAGIYALHRDLIKLRREDPVFRAQRYRGLDGAVLGPEAFVLRFFGENGDDRLVVVNFGLDLHLDPAPEPLLAPPESMRWKIIWSSENPKYGGSGTPQVDTPGNWRMRGHAAVVLGPRKSGESWS